MERPIPRGQPVATPCSECGGLLLLVKKTQRDYWRETGKAYCCAACSATARNRARSATMAHTNRRYASARMKMRNPMHARASREKMASTLRAIGHKPPTQGGNGRGPTASEAALAQALDWPTAVVVPTRRPRTSGWPTHYKIDVGNAALRIAVEIDGASHCALVRQQQDRKKDAVLRGCGWTVLRFSNRDVTERLEACVQMVRSTILRLQGSTRT